VRFAEMRDRLSGLERHPASHLAAGWWLTEDMFAWLLGGFLALRTSQPKYSKPDVIAAGMERSGLRGQGVS